ncbi:MAG: hypothetical protein HYY84_01155 [Deltaproteobacteria bacterium]|nr:hypothetical protein [Deltaproteobacteria bacterium]
MIFTLRLIPLSLLFVTGLSFAQETKPTPAPGLPPSATPETKPDEKKPEEKKEAAATPAVKPEEKKPETKPEEKEEPKKKKEEDKDYSSIIGLAGYFGFQVPLSAYINDLKNLPTDTAGSTYTITDLKNKIGFAMTLALKLSNWEFQYNWLVAPLDTLNFTPSPVTVNGTTYTSPKDMSAEDAYQFHSFTAAYKIYFTSGQVRPYLSPHLGIAFVKPGAKASTFLPGAEFGMGLGTDIHLTKGVALSLIIRYRFFITRNPNESEAQNAFLSSGTIPTANDIFSSFIETGSFLTIQAGLAFQL